MARAIGGAKPGISVEGMEQRAIGVADVIRAILRRHHREGLPRGGRTIGRIGQGLHFGFHANACPELRNGLRHFFIIRVAVIRGVDRDLKPIRIARLSQQAPRTIGFKRHGFEPWRGSRCTRRQHIRCNGSRPFHDTIHNRRAIDGMG